MVTALPGDITDPAHRGDLRRAAEALGGADLLINNAGTLGASPLPPSPSTRSRSCGTAFEVNVIAPIALTQLLLPALRRRGGAVLSVTSDAAVEAYAGWGGYGAAKAALEQACNVLAAEETAVRVWWVDPGDLRTQMHQQAFPGEDISDRPLPESVVPAFRRLIAERMPSGRYRAADLMPSAAAAVTRRRRACRCPRPRWRSSCRPSSRPRAARGAGRSPGRVADAGQPRRTGEISHHAVHRPAGPAAARRPDRGQHLGHAARRGPLRPRGWSCTSPPRCRTATGWSSCARPRRRHHALPRRVAGPGAGAARRRGR